MTTPIEPRWYCVDADGRATLCRDKEHADGSCADYNAAYPNDPHYRAVLLGDVAAERETIQRLREVMQRMVAGLNHMDKLAREWEPDHSSGADRAGWVRASHALNEARALLKT
jgi:hypothetical protein